MIRWNDHVLNITFFRPFTERCVFMLFHSQVIDPILKHITIFQVFLDFKYSALYF